MADGMRGVIVIRVIIIVGGSVQHVAGGIGRGSRIIRYRVVIIVRLAHQVVGQVEQFVVQVLVIGLQTQVGLLRH